MWGKRNGHEGLVLVCGLLTGSALAATIPEAPFVDIANTAALGTSVAIDGNTAVAGGPASPVNGVAKGVVFVFEKTGGGGAGWEMTKRIDYPDADLTSGFGSAVALSGG